MGDPSQLPKIEGIRFRMFKDPSDFELMSKISQKSWLADGFEWLKTKEEIEGLYAEVRTRDPAENLVFIDSESDTVGYGEFFADPVDSTTTSFWNYVHLLPEWRVKGIREAVLRYNERRLVEMARMTDARGYFQTWGCDEPNDWKDLLIRNGFAPSWYMLEMSRPDLDAVPDFPLPPGLEVRPVPPERYMDVWNGMKVAYRKEPWYSKVIYDDEHFRAWPTNPEFEPELWQVAWDGDRIAGAVQNYVNKEANRVFRRKVGHTEGIFVAEEWRHRGVARALISRSLRLLARLGMTEASLDVNAANVWGAMRLYSALGYRPVHKFAFFRKPLPF